jgi:hypothetical protein
MSISSLPSNNQEVRRQRAILKGQQQCNFDTDTKNHTPLRRDLMYETPEIVYEGDLEIQAGSPLSMPGDLDFEDWEW